MKAPTQSDCTSQRPIIISFSGIDGSGKTTQIENLIAWLRASGMRVHVVRFWDDVSLLTGLRESLGHLLFKGERGIGARDKPVRRRDKDVRAWYMTPIRLFLCSMDALGTARAVDRAQARQDADVIIFDRYIYDQLANLELEKRLTRHYVQAIVRLVPSPDIAFVIDAIPAHARERKPEYPLDFLELNRARYLALSQLAGLVVIPPGTAEQVEAEIRKHAMKKLALLQAEPAPSFLTSTSP
jgi:thymidylate kinase